MTVAVRGGKKGTRVGPSETHAGAAFGQPGQ